MSVNKVIYFLHYLVFLPIMLVCSLIELVSFVYSCLQVLEIEPSNYMVGYGWFIVLYMFTPVFLISVVLFFLTINELHIKERIKRIIYAIVGIVFVLMLQVVIAEFFF